MYSLFENASKSVFSLVAIVTGKRYFLSFSKSHGILNFTRGILQISVPGNGLNQQIQADLMPFHYLPEQPFVPSITFDYLTPSPFYTPTPSDPVAPFDIGYPLIFDYTLAYPLPYEILPPEAHPVPMSMPNNPIAKIGMTFPKPENIMEQPSIPFSLDYEKLLPKKVERTFPTTSLSSDQYSPPSRVRFGYESARMEPIIAQNLWNKK